MSLFSYVYRTRIVRNSLPWYNDRIINSSSSVPRNCWWFQDIARYSQDPDKFYHFQVKIPFSYLWYAGHIMDLIKDFIFALINLFAFSLIFELETFALDCFVQYNEGHIHEGSSNMSVSCVVGFNIVLFSITFLLFHQYTSVGLLITP
jgi:hypothetical protein